MDGLVVAPGAHGEVSHDEGSHWVTFRVQVAIVDHPPGLLAVVVEV